MKPLKEQAELGRIHPGDVIRAKWLNAAADNIRALAAMSGQNVFADKDGILRRPRPMESGSGFQSLSVGFPAQIMDQGPQGEADFTDYRYWVRECSITSDGDPTDPNNDPPHYDFATDGLWVVAINTVEINTGTDGKGTHGIRTTVDLIDVPDRVVTVFGFDGTRQDTGEPYRYYFFTSYPGQIQNELVGFRAESIDGEGCPLGHWYTMTGPAYLSMLL